MTYLLLTAQVACNLVALVASFELPWISDMMNRTDMDFACDKHN